MSPTGRVLVIDAGNTRIKWGVAEGDAWLALGAAAKDDADGLRRGLSPWLQAGGVAVCCNVAGATVAERITASLAEQGLSPRWFGSSERCLGVINGYANPRQLGPDRWAALVAAWQACASACVVVNAGTALTVDSLDAGGRFLGGLIAPGVATMLASLTSNTAGLPGDPGEHCAFPTRTADAMTTGAIDAAVGAIVRARGRLEERHGAPVPLVVSGGGAPRLLPHLDGDVRHREHLVLEGLRRFAVEEMPT